MLVPIIKGWLTEQAQQITSAAVQVHGGMGFIEETGVAQHYRDARILPIYEGTTAIQANDLIFRKTLRDNGAAVGALLDDIDSDMAALSGDGDMAEMAEMAELAKRLQEAVATTRKVVAHILASANTPRRGAVSGHNYLMLLGILTAGWQMVRGGAIAGRLLKEAGADKPFLDLRRGLAAVFIRQQLPQINALAEVIMHGDEAVLAIAPENLAEV